MTTTTTKTEPVRDILWHVREALAGIPGVNTPQGAAAAQRALAATLAQRR